MDSPSDSVFGAAVERTEDREILTGEATYTDDLSKAEMAHMAVLRSSHAHARIRGIDASDALDREGVLDVITARDLESAAPPTPNRFPLYPAVDLPAELSKPVLAADRVRYQGDPVAAVLAESRYEAHQALRAISVDYEVLDPVVDVHAATDESAPELHDVAEDNVALEWDCGDREAVAEAMDEAAATVDVDIDNQRLAPNPIEPRAAIAEFDPASEKISVTLPSQTPTYFRRRLSDILDYPEEKIRMVVPNIGGGFGAKMFLYPGEVLSAWSAMYLQRPVKWQATRSESYMADAHGRGSAVSGTLAVDESGNILALETENVADVGGYVNERNARLQTATFAAGLTNQYDVPALYHETTGVLTNKTPPDAYRGTSIPRAIILTERLVDEAARELDVDPVEIRRRNFVQPEQFPYETATGVEYDSGNYPKALDRALELVDYEDVKRRQERHDGDETHLGIGVGCFVEPAGLGPSESMAEPHWEYSMVSCQPSGGVRVHAGTSDMGTSHETVFAQIVSEGLGIPMEDIEVVEGDTDRIPDGTGSFGSRSAAVGGGAVQKSVEKVRTKAEKIAAHQLEAATADVEFEDGEFFVSGAPDRSITIQEIAEEAYLAENLPDEVDPGLDARSTYDPENITTTFGCHVAVVEVDGETGEIAIERYVAVDDCGNQINPEVVEGQIVGGIAQGIGEAIYEGVSYDDNGNLLTSSHQNYAVPKSFHVPEIETDFTVTPSPHNPLGVKGVGESGTIAAPTTLALAVDDALAAAGAASVDPPLTPERVWRALQGE